MKYGLCQLNSEHCQVLMKALDLYSRLLIGQFDMLKDTVTDWKKWSPKANELIEQLKQEVYGFSSGASYGIHSPEVDDDARVAWDVQQVLRNRLAWDRNPKGGMQVSFDSPMKSSEQPLVDIYRDLVSRDELIKAIHDLLNVKGCSEERQVEIQMMMDQLKNEDGVIRLLGLLNK